jgi:hypothetical protein
MHKPRFSALGIALSVIGISTIALAGKPERDKQKELEPKVAELKTDLKKKCGCDIAVTVDWASYKTTRDMGRIPHGLDSLTEALKDRCADDVDKKAICSHLKTFALKYDADAERPSLSGSTISCATTDVRYCGGALVKEITDKW